MPAPDGATRRAPLGRYAGMFDGYDKDAEATRETGRGDWVSVGDVRRCRRDRDTADHQEPAPRLIERIIRSKAPRCPSRVARGPVARKNHLASGPSAIAPSSM